MKKKIAPKSVSAKTIGELETLIRSAEQFLDDRTAQTVRLADAAPLANRLARLLDSAERGNVHLPGSLSSRLRYVSGAFANVVENHEAGAMLRQLGGTA